MSALLKITILTPSYNQAAFLERCIRSVLDQNYPNLEYMVMDGGSTDGSREILEKYDKDIAYWQSVPDRGQADALNQGFARAAGDILGWINSDDELLPGALEEVAAACAPDWHGLIAGPVENVDARGQRLRLINQDALNFVDMVRFWRRGGRTYHQPGILFSRKVWETCGPFDTDYRYMFDTDFLLKCVRSFPVIRIDCPLARFRVHSASKTGEEPGPFLMEAFPLYARYFEEAGVRGVRWPSFLVAGRLAQRSVTDMVRGQTRRASRQFRYGLGTLLNGTLLGKPPADLVKLERQVSDS